MGDVSNVQKSRFDVLGICCSSEIPLIEKLLNPLDGVQKVSVIVPSRTVIVVHDTLKTSQLEIVKVLNQARLEASITTYGGDEKIRKWPPVYMMACGLFLIISLFQSFFGPLKWLALVAVAIGLPQILLRSFAAIRTFTLDINTLMLIAVGGAIALRDYSEAGFIILLFTIAEHLQSLTSRKATSGMSALMSLAPQKAVLAETGKIVDAKEVMVDTILAIKAGEVIPIDGVVIKGKSEVDEKSLTGESVPVAKQPDSLVWAGTLNIDGYLSVKTTALAENSAAAKMARLVEEAQNNRSRTQRLIDSCAKYYTPVVVASAAGVAIFPVILRSHNLDHWFQFALVLLVSACPCALVLSTPIATFCTLLKAARLGLLFKGGDVIEDLAKTKVVAFDKTGTITRGEFSIMKFGLLSSHVSMNTLLLWISSLESKSSHPMASALIDYARLNSVQPRPENVDDFEIHPGEGVSGVIDGKTIYIGNKRIAIRAGCALVPDAKDTEEAVTLGYAFLGAQLIGEFALSDTCRTGAKEGIEMLKSMGIKTAMLTGDSTAAAMKAQEQLGNAIEEIHAELLPSDKVRIIGDLKANKGKTTMVGDGMNDAPALAMANVGISMGISGSAVAMETSHITLMSNDIRKIPKAIRLAKKTKRKIIENIIISFITKAAIIGLAIGGYPLLWAAVLADVGTCLLVILNSMALLGITKKTHTKCSHNLKSSNCHGNHGSHGCHKNNAIKCCQGTEPCKGEGINMDCRNSHMDCSGMVHSCKHACHSHPCQDNHLHKNGALHKHLHSPKRYEEHSSCEEHNSCEGKHNHIHSDHESSRHECSKKKNIGSHCCHEIKTSMCCQEIEACKANEITINCKDSHLDCSGMDHSHRHAFHSLPCQDKHLHKNEVVHAYLHSPRRHEDHCSCKKHNSSEGQHGHVHSDHESANHECSNKKNVSCHGCHKNSTTLCCQETEAWKAKENAMDSHRNCSDKDHSIKHACHSLPCHEKHLHTKEAGNEHLNSPKKSGEHSPCEEIHDHSHSHYELAHFECHKKKNAESCNESEKKDNHKEKKCSHAYEHESHMEGCSKRETYGGEMEQMPTILIE